MTIAFRPSPLTWASMAAADADDDADDIVVAGDDAAIAADDVAVVDEEEMDPSNASEESLPLAGGALLTPEVGEGDLIFTSSCGCKKERGYLKL